MNEGLIPNRYARALYRYSRDCGDADTVYAQTCRLADSFLRVDGIASAAENPFLALADKEALLLAAAGAPGDGTLSKFVKLVYAHGREAFFCQMALAFGKMYRSDKGIAQVVITSAAPLPAQAFDKIKAFLKSCLHGKSIEYKVDVDPELIGGFTIKIDSLLLDASLSSELRDLRLKLISKK